MAGDYERAREVLLGPARDPSAPPVSRAEAYRLLLRIVGNELGEWEFAKVLLDEWLDLAPGDPNASAWMPRVVNQLRTSTS